MPEAFLTLLFGLLGDFTFWCYKLCCTAVLLQCERPWASNERGLEREKLCGGRSNQCFGEWHSGLLPCSLVLTPPGSTQWKWKYWNACARVGWCLFQSVAQPRLTVLARVSVGSPCSQSQVGDEKQQVHVALEHAALGGQGISIPGDL